MLEFVLIECFLTTQGNYATQDNIGMCHLMPQRHLPEWREDDERAFRYQIKA